MASKEPAVKRPKTEQSSLTSFFKSFFSNPPKEKSIEEKKAEISDDKVKADNDTTTEEGKAIVLSQVPMPHNVLWKLHQESCIYRCLHDEVPRNKVAAFDLDGTLLESHIRIPGELYAGAVWEVTTTLKEVWACCLPKCRPAQVLYALRILLSDSQATSIQGERTATVCDYCKAAAALEMAERNFVVYIGTSDEK